MHRLVVSLSDLIPLPNFGELLQGLRINDELRDYKFYRGLGAVLAIIGIVLFFFFQTLAILVNPAFIRLADYSIILIAIGTILLIVFFALGKRHRELDEREREAEIDEKESKSNINDALADRLDGRSTFQDRQYGERDQTDDKSEPDATTVTVESKDK